jgi:hypothetical protein
VPWSAVTRVRFIKCVLTMFSSRTIIHHAKESRMAERISQAELLSSFLEVLFKLTCAVLLGDPTACSCPSKVSTYPNWIVQSMALAQLLASHSNATLACIHPYTAQPYVTIASYRRRATAIVGPSVFTGTQRFGEPFYSPHRCTCTRLKWFSRRPNYLRYARVRSAATVAIEQE